MLATVGDSRGASATVASNCQRLSPTVADLCRKRSTTYCRSSTTLLTIFCHLVYLKCRNEWMKTRWYGTIGRSHLAGFILGIYIWTTVGTRVFPNSYFVLYFPTPTHFRMPWQKRVLDWIRILKVLSMCIFYLYGKTDIWTFKLHWEIGTKPGFHYLLSSNSLLIPDNWTRLKVVKNS